MFSDTMLTYTLLLDIIETIYYAHNLMFSILVINLIYFDKLDIIHSFSRKWYPYDNATIEPWYNRVHIHSSIDYLTPTAVASGR